MKSRILGPLGVLRIAGEPFIRRRPADAGDESIWDFAARRLGKQAADRLIAPVTLGIFAGDARRLSLQAAFPKLHELEREHGSLIRGMIARKRAKAGGGGPAGPAGWLTSFGQGLEQLPAALGNQPGVKVRLGAAVNSVIPDPDGGFKVLVEGDGEPLPADAVILAGEAWAMAPVLQEAVPEAATNLATIPCPPVIVVALGFGPDALAKVPRGFGALIARTEGYRILGCLWDTHLFAGRSPDGKLLLRVMLGGSVDAPVADLDDAAIMETVLDDLKRLLAIEEKPLLEKVIRWQRAIPQYELGHLERARVIEDSLARLPGLYMAGNALHGVAFTKAATLGMQRAREAVAYLSAEKPDSDI